MIKLIIFDLDGVLVDAREIHYKALNTALEQAGLSPIPRDKHLSTFDGLSTKKKLELLEVPESVKEYIWHSKQQATLQILDGFKEDIRLKDLLMNLQRENYTIACATNSIRDTAKLQLIRKGFMEHIDFLISQTDVINPKPHTEIYLKCMIRAGVDPTETLIIEDSHIGRKGAMNSGAHLCGVENTKDVTYAKIKNAINVADGKSTVKPKWQGGDMNVLIPLAGAGSRFETASYTFPKPLIDVNGKPMIQLVVENINIDAKYIFIVQKEHYNKYNLKYLLNLITNNNCEIVQVDELTEGAACTTLLAKDYIDNNKPLVIANSDQWVDWESNEFMYAMGADNVEGGILTFPATHPKWSFAKLDKDGFVSEVAEKKVISNRATVGIYYWKKGSDYVNYAEQMIEKDIRTNGEFYVCPVFNEAIADNKKIKQYPIKKMMGLGTPEDLEIYLKETNVRN